MSCINLPKSHYQYIADSLYSITVHYAQRVEFYRTRQLFDGHLSTEREGKIIALISALQEENLLAYGSRYGEESDSYVDPVTKIGSGDFSAPKLLKALRSVDYQCSEHVGWELSEARAELHLILDDVARFICESNPDYIAGSWIVE